MKSKIYLLPATVIMVLVSATPQAQQDTVDIYWIDVDSGAATLIVTPEGISALMDAGYARPDDSHAKRVVAAMTDAGITGLDYFIASHFHGDHVGGAEALSGLVPIDKFIDHGESVEQETERGRPAWESYLAAIGTAEPTPVTPGDVLPLGSVNLTVVSSNLMIPGNPLDPQGPNALCQNADPGEENTGENARSVGYMLSLGDFEFLNLGDLTFRGQHALACPENLIGVVDLLQIPHHGNNLAPQLIGALNATAAVSSTGARKGGDPVGYEVVAAMPNVEGIWQLHRALATDDDHNTVEAMIANLTEEEDPGHWIKAEVTPDGSSYTIINGRNGHSVTYTSR